VKDAKHLHDRLRRESLDWQGGWTMTRREATVYWFICGAVSVLAVSFFLGVW